MLERFRKVGEHIGDDMVGPSVPPLAEDRGGRHDRPGANGARSLGSSLSLLALCGALGACSSMVVEQPAAAVAGPRPVAAPSPPALVGTAWDNFNHRGTVMWACRDLATGDIVSSSLCFGLTRDDRHWPGMAVPPSYRGMPEP